ncbi:MAG: glycosyltransferase family 2 protein [Thermoanaerobaculia bacterium]
MSSLTPVRDPGAKVAVIIVNWNAAEDTLDVLGQLDGCTGARLEYIVVDNASTDDSVARMRAARSELILIESGSNPGFAGGTIAGVRRALEDPEVGYVLFLNNDVRVDPGFLPPLLDACRDLELAAAGPKIFYAEPSDRIWAAGGTLRVRETVTKELGRGRLDGAPFDRGADVTYLTTCCILIPVDVFERVGLLDPVYFICVEDADWCRRATSAGYRLRYVPESSIWHRVAVSTGGGYTPLRTFHTARSNALFVRRHHGIPGRLWFLLANLAALPAAFLRELPKGNAKAVFAKARGLWRGLREPLGEPPRL